MRKKGGLIVGAYRANMESLFPLCTRKKQTPFPAKLIFANRQLMKDAVNPFTLSNTNIAQIGMPIFLSFLWIPLGFPMCLATNKSLFRNSTKT